MVRFVSLSSGSNGNCYYLGDEKHALLIDLGIGGRTIKKRLSSLGISFDTVSFILVSHDHVDHIKYLGGFTDYCKKPVYVTKALHSALNDHFCTRGHMTGFVKDTEPGVETEVLGIRFTPFSVPHDAHDTVGYYIDFKGETFTFITDLGTVTEDAVAYCRKAKHLIVESNYDLDMLLQGTYPYILKQRIMNGSGHLSNDQTASLLKRSYHPELESVFLCHLSENNNTPELALNSAKDALNEVGAKNVPVVALPRRESSSVFEF